MVDSKGVSTIRISTLRKLLKDFYEKFNITECSNISNTSDVKKCLSAINNILTNLLKDFENPYECFEICINSLDIDSTVSRLNRLYMNIIKYYTTLGDSVINRDEAPKQIMRGIRHLEISSELGILHIYRLGYAEKILHDLKNCLVKKCKPEIIEDVVNKLISLATRSNNVEEINYTNFFVERLKQLLNELKERK